MDDEVTYLLAGWAGVFISLGGLILSAALGFVLLGLGWWLVMSAAFLVLGYAFVRFRVPEIINFFKSEEVREWTRSLGR